MTDKPSFLYLRQGYLASLEPLYVAQSAQQFLVEALTNATGLQWAMTNAGEDDA